MKKLYFVEIWRPAFIKKRRVSKSGKWLGWIKVKTYVHGKPVLGFKDYESAKKYAVKKTKYKDLCYNIGVYFADV